jgi:hypothetical protein
MFVGLDVAIGLILVFSLVSLMCSAVQEWFAAWFNLRGKLLWHGIDRLLGAQLKEAVARNHLVAGLKIKEEKAGKQGKRPSYVHADTFVAALLDSLGGGAGNSPTTAASVRALVGNLPQGKPRDALLALVDAGNNDLERVKANIAGWYNAAMDRVSGWYKRRAQLMLFVIALVVVPAVGVDTIKLAKALYADPALRASVVASSEKVIASQPQPTPVAGAAADTTAGAVAPVAGDPKPPLPAQAAKQQGGEGEKDTLRALKDAEDRYKKANADLALLNVPTATFNEYTVDATPPLPRTFETFFNWLWVHILGFLLTAIAASLGAPFWFDLLNRFVNLRASGNKPTQADT